MPPAASFLGKKLGKNLSEKGYEQPYSPFKEIKWLHFSLFGKFLKFLETFFQKVSKWGAGAKPRSVSPINCNLILKSSSEKGELFCDFVTESCAEKWYTMIVR